MNRKRSIDPPQVRVAVEHLEARKLLAAVRIMPLGDSITNAFVGDASYRFWLHKQLELGGYDVDFVGSRHGVHDDAAPDNQGAPRYSDFDQDHEGNGGVRTDQILADLPRILGQNVPDVVLLHAGSNDMFQSFGIEETIDRLGQIIDTFRATNPDVDVLLAQVIPSRVLVENLQALNAQIPALAEAKDTVRSRVLAVDQFTGFSATDDLRDEYHPNLFGERKIAAKWYSTLVRLLPAPDPAPTPVKFLTELRAVSATNGQGPVEVDLSSGGRARNDGGALNLNGVTSFRGLGAHANSEVVYNLGGTYARFLADVGVDDEVGSAGSVVFQVYVDGALQFDSGVMTGASATKSVDVSVRGAQQLRLVVTDAADGNAGDHADWANARLTLVAPAPEPEPQPEPTPEPTPEPGAPTVISSDFVFKTRPHKLKFTFSGDVSGSLDRGDIVLKNLTTGWTVAGRRMRIHYDASSNTSIFCFPGLRRSILPDGRYEATIKASGVTDSSGRALAGDYSSRFFFLTGDANHDGVVGRADFDILRSNLGRKRADFNQGDFNYNRKVGMDDLAVLAGRWGMNVDSTSTRLPKGKQLKRLIQDLRDDLRGDDDDDDRKRDKKSRNKHRGGDDD